MLTKCEIWVRGLRHSILRHFRFAMTVLFWKTVPPQKYLQIVSTWICWDRTLPANRHEGSEDESSSTWLNVQLASRCTSRCKTAGWTDRIPNLALLVTSTNSDATSFATMRLSLRRFLGIVEPLRFENLAWLTSTRLLADPSHIYTKQAVCGVNGKYLIRLRWLSYEFRSLKITRLYLQAEALISRHIKFVTKRPAVVHERNWNVDEAFRHYPEASNDKSRSGS